jgi:hypothetical protein
LGTCQWLRRTKKNVAIRADASCRVQMDPAALTAFEVNRSRSRKAQVLGDEDVLRKHSRTVEVVQYVGGERCRSEAVLLRDSRQVLSDVGWGIRLAGGSVR